MDSAGAGQAARALTATIHEEALRAREFLSEFLVPTPCRRSPHFSERLGFEVFLKPENIQRTGSFKIRGALYGLSRMDPKRRAWGVVAASAGNHAQGVAFAAQRMGTKAVILMPEGTPITKYQAVRELGAEALLRGATFDDAYAEAKKVEAERGLAFIHPFDDPALIAGQATVGLEILEEGEAPDAIIVPVGGGGLISGVAAVVKTLRPEVQVVGVVAEGAPGMLLSIRAGRVVEPDGVATIADGIAVRRVGERTFPLVRDLVDKVVSVSDDEIARAVLQLLEREHLLVEGAGATVLAALLARKFRPQGHRVVLLLSGGNLDVNLLSRIIGKGLALAGRYARLLVPLRDVPGSLAKLAGEIAACQVNIIHIEHDRMSTQVPINHTLSTLHLEVRGRDHLETVMNRLLRSGYQVTQPEEP
ncbi:MAG: threonine ammonia-lyase [Nitrospinota bacterium]